MRDENYPEADDGKVIPIKVETGFNEMMVEQLGMLNLDEHEHQVAEQLLGSLDDDGYLRRDLAALVDDMAFRQNIITTEEELAKLVLQIQQFDPPGVGARNLQECLLLQLERKISEGIHVETAMKVLDKYFDEFTKNEIAKNKLKSHRKDSLFSRLIDQRQ